MWRVCANWLRKFDVLRYRRRIQSALELNRRGEVRSDGLKLQQVRSRLEIRWHARDIHPWDRDLPPEIKIPMFIEQSLNDTEAALDRLFAALPEIEVINLTVMAPATETAIIAGTVHRSMFETSSRLLSIRMRIRELGLFFRITGSDFEPLSIDLDSQTLTAI